MPRSKKPTKKPKPESTTSTLEGWSRVIRDAGEDSRRKEAVRKETAEKALADLTAHRDDVPFDALVSDLLDLLDGGLILEREFFEALRSWVR